MRRELSGRKCDNAATGGGEGSLYCEVKRESECGKDLGKMEGCVRMGSQRAKT
jgi:hypothetical protein